MQLPVARSAHTYVMDFRWLALRIGPYGVVWHSFCFFQPSWEKQYRRGIVKRNSERVSLVWGFRGAFCAACPALPPPPITAGLWSPSPLCLQPIYCYPTWPPVPFFRTFSVLLALSQNSAISSTLPIDDLLFSFPGCFPCSSLFPNRFLCAVRSWLPLFWSAWKVSQGPQRADLSTLSPWCFLAQMDSSWDCLHYLPRTFIIFCQIRLALKPCSFGWLLSSYRNNVISNNSVASVMLIFKTFIQILTTK